MTDHQKGRLEFTVPRDAWGGEAAAFTPLLAQPHMLEYLAEATGVGSLTLLGVEHATAETAQSTSSPKTLMGGGS